MHTLLKAATIAGAALALAASGISKESKLQTGFLNKSYQRNGKEYRYVVYVPRGYDAAKKWPAIMFLHGYGECGTDGWKPVAQGIGTAVLWDADKWPFIIVIPQKTIPGSEWEQHDDVVMKTLSLTREQYSVDPHRIYLTGLSQGGHGTWVEGSMHTDIWAAIAPICGYPGAAFTTDPVPGGGKPFTGSVDDLATKLKGMPVWAFHGEADSVVPVQHTKDLVAAINAKGGSAKQTLYPGIDHNSWDKAYREENLPAWFLQHTR
ncbi:MAG TPA: PHB depolymerase family esterase [Armatimonadota bacterium]